MKRAKRCLDLVSLDLGDPKAAAAGLYASSPILNGGFLSAAVAAGDLSLSSSLGSTSSASASPSRGKRVRLGPAPSSSTSSLGVFQSHSAVLNHRPDPFEMRFDLMSLLLDSSSSASGLSSTAPSMAVHHLRPGGIQKSADASRDFDIALELNPFGPVDHHLA